MLDEVLMSNAVPIVTIDGPSGAGKGTICKLVADKTGFHLLDSGSLYRLTALASLNSHVLLEDENAVAEQAKALDVCFEVVDNKVKILLAGEEVTQTIREERIGMAASTVAAQPLVRAALLERQRAFACAPGLIADGRDMGTVVFPYAAVKIFLTASAAERAQRRLEQLRQTGVEGDYQTILADIEARDERDRTRTTAPLVPAKDAIVLDSTELSIEQVLEKVLEEVKQKYSERVAQ